MDEIRFNNIIKTYQKENNTKIGMLSEKTLHAIIKKYLCEDSSFHEQKIGSYYADIFSDGEIIEIQTRSLNKLRPKLDYYLDKYKVTVVYPIVHYKYLMWIDHESGEISERRKSPRVGKIADCFFELYKIKMYLNHPNLKIKILLIDCDEYRNLNGWSKDKKRGSTRYERIPIKLIDEVDFNSPEDYNLFLNNLPDEFTNEDLKKELKIQLKYATIATNIFKHLNLIEVKNKIGRKNLYSKRSLT